MLITIITAVIVLGGLIFFHECGHYLAARFFGMGVATFSIGFGPKILKFYSGHTEYALSLIPLGGYVNLVGEGEDEEVPEGFTIDECFSLRPAWQRLIVFLAGPTFNIILAWLICWIMAAVWGSSVLLPQVGRVIPGSPAEQVGLKSGDTILRVNGVEISAWDSLSEAIVKSNGNPLQLMVSRPNDLANAQLDNTNVHSNMSAILDKNASILQITVTPHRSNRKTLFGEDEEAWMLGINAAGSSRHVKLGIIDSAKDGFVRTWQFVHLTWQSLVKLVQRVIPLDQVGGPIMIAQMLGKQAEQGLFDVLGLAALISINLGVLNLLPIPVLDGGQILFCFFETLIRKPIPVVIQVWSMRFGIVCLLTIMVIATYNDIMRLLQSAG